MSDPASRSAEERRLVVPADGASIATAAGILRRGGLVAFPTETVYGLGALASDPAAVGRIFAAKGRPADHPLIVHLGDPAWLDRWARDVPAAAQTLADAFWPGPLTLVLHRADGVSDVVTGGADTVGLRMPAHPVARDLLAAVGDALAAPSANRFGRISPTRAAHVADELGGAIEMILDGGPCRVGVESTIVDLSGAAPRLLRPGGVPVEAVEDALGAAVPAADRDSPRAPGTLPSHYAPGTRTTALPRRELEAAARQGDGVLGFGSRPVDAPGRWLMLPADPEAAARELYAALRTLDAAGADRILLELPPPTPPWRTVRDRMVRAATPR